MDDIETVEQIYCSYKGAPWVDENNHIISDDFLMEQLNLMQRVVDNNVDARADQWSAGWTSGQTQTHLLLREGVLEEAAVLPILGVDGTSLLMADQELQSVLPRKRFLWLRFPANQTL